MEKVTVIVPVYNAEKTIQRTLESILKQQEYIEEIIVINDGSTDQTDPIARKYADKYPNLISYHRKKNEGVATTRNYGIREAKTEYILFVDADDWIAENLLETVQPYLDQKIDMVKYKLQYVDENGQVMQTIEGPIFEALSGEEAFNRLVFSDTLIDSPCIYIFRKRLITKTFMYFQEGTEHEDFGLMPILLLEAKTVVSLGIVGYFYEQGVNSIIRNNDYESTKKRIQDLFTHYDRMTSWLTRKELTGQTKKNIKTYYTNVILLKLGELHKKERSDAIRQVRQRRMISNLQVHNFKQFCKKVLVMLHVNWYVRLKQ